MARAPSLYLRREDYREVRDEWMDRLLRPLNTFGKQVQEALSNSLTIGENSRAFVKTMDVTCPGWSGLNGFANGWENFGDPYRTVAAWRCGWRVRVRGVAKNGGAPSYPSIVLPLPVGYQPAGTQYLPVVTAGNAAGAITIAQTGIAVQSAGSPASGVSFDGVEYDTADAPPPLLSLKFARNKDWKPALVLVGAAYDVAGSVLTPVALGSVAWSANDSSVIVTDIAGMTPGRSHRVTFIVLGG